MNKNKKILAMLIIALIFISILVGFYAGRITCTNYCTKAYNKCVNAINDRCYMKETKDNLTEIYVLEYIDYIDIK